MIIRERTSGRLSGGQRVLLAAVLPAILLFVPIAADQAADSRDDAGERADAETADRIQQQIHEIERQQFELQRKLEQLLRQRAEIAGDDLDSGRVEEIARLEDEIATLQRAGRFDEASELREQIARRDDARRLQGELKRAYANEMARGASVKAEIRALQIAAEELTEAGDTRGAEDSRLEARQLEAELAEIAYEAEVREMEMSHEMRAQREYERARELAGRGDAESAEAEKEAQELETRRIEAELRFRKALDLERKIAQLHAEAKAAEERGETDLAEKYLEQARQLEDKLPL